MGKYEPIDTWEKSKSFSKEINVNDLIIEELEKIKAEFEDKILLNQTVAIQIIDKHILELKGEINANNKTN